MLRAAIQYLAKSLGYVIVPQWRLTNLPAAIHLRKLLQLLEVDCVVDVGANTGQYRDFLRMQVGYEGPIVSFEPIPEHVDTLVRRAKHDPNWLIQGCALGAQTGELALNVMQSTTFSSFQAPDHGAVSLFKEANKVDRQLMVPIRTLDSVMPEIERRFQCAKLYLKLDTQGFDLEVVKGATKTIPRIRALQTEASVKPIYKGMPDYASAIGALQEFGFELSGIFPNTEGHFPLLVEFDAVLVKREFVIGKVGA